MIAKNNKQKKQLSYNSDDFNDDDVKGGIRGDVIVVNATLSSLAQVS
jgi:hypothetical protein